jgi:hypothetical protein
VLGGRWGMGGEAIRTGQHRHRHRHRHTQAAPPVPTPIIAHTKTHNAPEGALALALQRLGPLDERKVRRGLQTMRHPLVRLEEQGVACVLRLLLLLLGGYVGCPVVGGGGGWIWRMAMLGGREGNAFSAREHEWCC